MASGSVGNSRSKTGMPLLSALLRKNRTVPLEDAADRRFPLRDRVETVSEPFFESAGASVMAASSLFTSFLQKLALLKKVGVAFSNHLLFGEFGDKQPAGVRFRPAVFHEADVVTADNPVGRFHTLPHAMNLFHAEDYVRPRGVLNRFNRANEKLRRDSVLFDFSDRVVVPELAE